jgi:hypothetical protein
VLRRRCVTETLCYGDILSRTHFVMRRCVYRRFEWRRFFEDTFCMLAAYIACQKCYYGAASFLHPIVSLHIYSFGGKLLIEVALNVKMAKKIYSIYVKYHGRFLSLSS